MEKAERWVFINIPETPLCKLAFKYGTDKCPKIKHPYTVVYHDMFKRMRKKVRKILEVGIGNYEDMKHVDEVFDPRLNRRYKKGASLKMWRDYFPNAMVYGVDIVPDSLFKSERIKTYLCDETKPEEVNALIDQIGSDIDIVIDDGSHVWRHQANLAKTLLPLLPKDVIYVIEDIERPDPIIDRLREYECVVPTMPVVRYKKGYAVNGKRKNKIPKDRLLIVKNNGHK